MTTVPTFVLPGMDGTGKLLRDFRDVAPESHAVTVIALPSRVMDGYDALSRHVGESLPNSGRVLLIAESFSGAIAVKLASRLPDCVLGIVLVASLVDSPAPFVARLIPWKFVFRFPLPGFAARMALVGRDASNDDVREVQNAIREVPSGVMADRLKKVVTVNKTRSLETCKCPLLYIRPTADRLVPERCWQAIRRLRPDTKLVSIDGPHFILQRKPKEAWRHISEFTRTISGAVD